MNVGREHVVSMVNTLAMAYAGGALPLLLLLTLNNGNPLWVSLNNELIVEEIVRTIAGSIGLLLAVPITTLIASKFLSHKSSGKSNEEGSSNLLQLIKKRLVKLKPPFDFFKKKKKPMTESNIEPADEVHLVDTGSNLSEPIKPEKPTRHKVNLG